MHGNACPLRKRRERGPARAGIHGKGPGVGDGRARMNRAHGHLARLGADGGAPHARVGRRARDAGRLGRRKTALFGERHAKLAPGAGHDKHVGILGAPVPRDPVYGDRGDSGIAASPERRPSVVISTRSAAASAAACATASATAACVNTGVYHAAIPATVSARAHRLFSAALRLRPLYIQDDIVVKGGPVGCHGRRLPGRRAVRYLRRIRDDCRRPAGPRAAGVGGDILRLGRRLVCPRRVVRPRRVRTRGRAHAAPLHPVGRGWRVGGRCARLVRPGRARDNGLIGQQRRERAPARRKVCHGRRV